MADLSAPTTVVPPIPFKSPMLDKSGLLSNTWGMWFNQLVARVGGVGHAVASDDISDSVVTLDNEVAALQLAISNLQSTQAGLGVGPVL